MLNSLFLLHQSVSTKIIQLNNSLQYKLVN